MLCKAKEQHLATVIQDNVHDIELLFCTVDKLLSRNIDKKYPSANSDQEFANALANFFIPYEIRKSNNISSFKRSLKTYFLTKFSNNRSFFL